MDLRSPHRTNARPTGREQGAVIRLWIDTAQAAVGRSARRRTGLNGSRLARTASDDKILELRARRLIPRGTSFSVLETGYSTSWSSKLRAQSCARRMWALEPGTVRGGLCSPSGARAPRPIRSRGALWLKVPSRPDSSALVGTSQA